MRHGNEIHSCAELMAYIQEVGFLPLLDSGIAGYSAEAVVDDDSRYVLLPDGGWDWPCGNGKAPSCSRASVCMASFLRVRPAL